MEPQPSLLDRLANVGWGTITGILLGTPGVLSLLGAATGTTATVNTLMDGGFGVFMIGLILSIAIGATVRAAGPPPRPAFETPGAVAFAVRRSTNPYLVGYVSFILFVCPVSMLLFPLMPVIDRAQSTHFSVSMLAMALITAAAAWLFRPLAMAATSRALFVQELFGSQRYDWISVESVEADPKAQKLLIRRTNGKSVRIDCSRMAPHAVAAFARKLDRLATAVAKDAQRTPADDGAHWSALDRNGRSLAEWRAALRRLVSSDESYRAVPVTAADLVPLVRDDRVSAERRLAAAMALRDSGHADAAEHIRVAIDGAADKPTRVALKRILDDSIDERAVTRSIAADVAARRRV